MVLAMHAGSEAAVIAFVVPEWFREWGLPLLFAAVIGAALVRPTTTLVAVAILSCLAALALREFSTIPLSRAWIHRRYAAGIWTREYTEGVHDVLDYMWASGRYVAIAGLGLAFLAIRLFYRQQRPD